MNHVLLVILFVLGTRARAQEWPTNTESHAIEFRGQRPWPADARTIRQRQALVEHWYWTRLTDKTPPEISAERRPGQSPGTAERMPRRARLQYAHGGQRFLLSYEVTLIPGPKGLAFVLSDFRYAWSQEDTGSNWDLETALKNSFIDRTALSLFHRRVNAAMTGW